MVFHSQAPVAFFAIVVVIVATVAFSVLGRGKTHGSRLFALLLFLVALRHSEWALAVQAQQQVVPEWFGVTRAIATVMVALLFTIVHVVDPDRLPSMGVLAAITACFGAVFVVGIVLTGPLIGHITWNLLVLVFPVAALVFLFAARHQVFGKGPGGPQRIQGFLLLSFAFLAFSVPNGVMTGLRSVRSFGWFGGGMPELVRQLLVINIASGIVVGSLALAAAAVAFFVWSRPHGPRAFLWHGGATLLLLVGSLWPIPVVYGDHLFWSASVVAFAILGAIGVLAQADRGIDPDPVPSLEPDPQATGPERVPEQNFDWQDRTRREDR